MKKVFKLYGLGCANCAAKMENAIGKLDGVKSAAVNFITAKLIIEFEEEKLSSIIEAAERIVKKIESDVIMKEA